MSGAPRYSKEVTAVILAGGRSRRFGQDKAAATLLGKRLIDRVVGQLPSDWSHRLVVANDLSLVKDTNLPVIGDLIPHHGPMGGILTALKFICTDWALVIACDLPLIETSILRLIGGRAMVSEADVVVPLLEGRYQPLVAAYRRTCIPTLDRLILQRRLKMVDFFPKARLDCLRAEEIAGAGGSSWSFHNINTQDEFVLAERHLRDEMNDLVLETHEKSNEKR